MKTKVFTLFLLSFIFQSGLRAQNLTFTLFASGMDSITDMKNAGDSRLFVVEQQGTILIVDSAGNVKPKPFIDIADKIGTAGNEEGLLGIAFSPNYKKDGYFFLHYTDINQAVHIARFKVSSTNPDSADEASETTVIKIYHPYQNHNGGNIMFGPDGYLYDGLGDGGSGGDPGNRAQNLDSLLGKMLRLNVDSLPYTIPSTNPFAGGSSPRPEIWAYGLRNPWCYSFDRLTGDLWIGDVGQDTWEEVDFQPSNDTGGENYGWRCYEGDAVYDFSQCSSTTNFTYPVSVYKHKNGGDCCIIGGYVYRGAQYKSLFGKYFFTDLCTGLFRSVQDSVDSFITKKLNVLTTYECTKFGQDIYGELYIAEREPGKIYKISDTSCAPVAFISFNDTIQSPGDTTLTALYGVGLTYQWQHNGKDITGATSNVFKADSSGTYTVIVSNSKSCSSTASVFVSMPTGVNNILFFKKVQIIPNPNSGTFDLNVSIPINIATELTINDVLGRTLFSENVSLNVGTNKLHVSDKGLVPGIYFLKLNSYEGSAVKQFVITE